MNHRHLSGIAAALLACTAHAAPTGPNVVAGSATVSTNGSATVISQTSNNAVINWNTFNVGSGQSVQFAQPSASSATLNRVVTPGQSLIAGSVTANGRIYFVNPNGFWVQSGGSINAAGVGLSTSDISDANFMAGNVVFDIPATAPGEIKIDGALSADAILIAGDSGVLVSGTLQLTGADAGGVDYGTLFLPGEAGAVLTAMPAGTARTSGTATFLENGGLTIGSGSLTIASGGSLIVPGGPVPIPGSAGTIGNGNPKLWTAGTITLMSPGGTFENTGVSVALTQSKSSPQLVSLSAQPPTGSVASSVPSMTPPATLTATLVPNVTPPVTLSRTYVPVATITVPVSTAMLPPQAPLVISGTATLSPTPGAPLVLQTSGSGVINLDAHRIGPDATANFQPPSASRAELNRADAATASTGVVTGKLPAPARPTAAAATALASSAAAAMRNGTLAVRVPIVDASAVIWR